MCPFSRLEVLEQNLSASWKVVKRYSAVNTDRVTETFTGLDVDALYSFRVSVVRADESGKLMTDWTPGFRSPFYPTQCIGKLDRNNITSDIDWK